MRERITGAEENAALLASWARHLRGKRLAAATIDQYLRSGRYFTDWLGERTLLDVGRGDVEDYLAHVGETTSDGTAAVRYRCLKQLYRWLTDVVGEVERNPFDGTPQPKVDDVPPAVLTVAQVQAVIAACEGRAFEDRRDEALVRLFADAGLRIGEMAKITVPDVDLDGRVTVTGKRKTRTAAFGARTGDALDRYLLARRRHPAARHPELWLGVKGPLTYSGIYQAVRRRGRAAGLPDLHPHVFRHTFAHHFLASGGQENDLMQLAGWASNQMVGRYGRSAAAERAREAHKEHGLGDKL